MPLALFQHVEFTAIEACTGPVVRSLDDEAHLYAKNPDQLDRLKRLTGLNTRHLAPPGVTALDLCQQAAQRLLSACQLAPASVDAILCVTQTPDYWQPCNACLLHGRLGFSKSTAAFDVNQGCSGWVYGAYLAAAMIEAGGCQRVLLLAGDTVSQTVHPADRATVPLFGDAGTATLLERAAQPSPAWFALHSDGTGWQAIHIPAGAFRRPKGPDTCLEEVDAEGNTRTAEHLVVNGMDVFNFSLREEPRAVSELLHYAGMSLDDVDYVVFHQANRFILDNLARRLKVSAAKAPMDTAGRFGNQSSASIPATICDALATALRSERKRVLCSGFGVGLSWASCLTWMGPFRHCHLAQYRCP